MSGRIISAVAAVSLSLLWTIVAGLPATLNAAMADENAEVNVAQASPLPVPAEVRRAAPATAPSEVNLLSPEQGGQAIVVPNSEWLKAISGKDGELVTGVNAGQEAVYAFKDERPATFSKFSILVTGSSDCLPKEIELLVADDSPTGTFRSISKVTVVNALLVKSPYQESSLPETTAKYVKIKILSGCGGGCGSLPQIRILGRPVQ